MQVLIETDIFSDVDDVGALAIAHAFADSGAVDLISIGVNTPSRYGPWAVRIINAFHARDVPVGGVLPVDDSVAHHDFAKFLCTTYPHLAGEANVEPALRVHRAALQLADDHNVAIVSLGFFGNLQDLLRSEPDDLSPLSGRELIEQKVVRLVVMGGYFPDGREFNVAEYPSVAKTTIDEWPTPVEFLGWEVGAPVVTGASISRDGPVNVIGAAYRQYGGAGRGRESWDPMTVHFALADDSVLYGLSPRGTVHIAEDGTTTFVESAAGRHRHVILDADAGAAAAELNAMLESVTRRAASEA